MASPRTGRPFAYGLSIAGHAAIVAALTFSLPLSTPQRAVGPTIVPIDTIMIDESAIEAELARIEAEEQERIRAEEERARRQREEAERAERERVEVEQQAAREREELARIQRQREEEQRAAEADRIRLQAEARAEEERLARLEEERRQREAEEARQRAAEEEQRRQAELARQREEEERRRQEAERAAQLARIEADIARSRAAEEEAQRAREAGQLDQWIRQIENRITQRWNRPPSADFGTECIVVVNLIPSGEVTSVTVESCNRDATVVRSVENAVLEASPLPLPSPMSLFERVLRIRFLPDE